MEKSPIKNIKTEEKEHLNNSQEVNKSELLQARKNQLRNEKKELNGGFHLSLIHI